MEAMHGKQAAVLSCPFCVGVVESTCITSRGFGALAAHLPKFWSVEKLRVSVPGTAVIITKACHAWLDLRLCCGLCCGPCFPGLSSQSLVLRFLAVAVRPSSSEALFFAT